MCFVVVYLVISILLILLFQNAQPSDCFQYQRRATEVAQLKGLYPHSHNLYDTPHIWPSLYINVLGILYLVFGSEVIIGKCLNVLLTFTQFVLLEKIILLFLKKRDILFGFYILFFLYPNIYFMNLLITAEPLFITFLLCCLFLFLKTMFTDTKSAVNFTAVGLCIAMAILTKPVALLIPVCMLLFFIYRRTPVTLILVFCLSLCCTLLLYGMNTKTKLGKFNAWGTTGGYNLFLANNPYSTGRYNSKSTEYVDSFTLEGTNVFERNRIYTTRALEYISAHPFKTIKNTGKKILFLFAYDGKQIETAFYKGTQISRFSIGEILAKLTIGPVSWMICINQMVYFALLLFILLGIYQLIRQKRFHVLTYLLAFPLSVLLVTLLALASTRFHYPIIIMCFPLTAFGFCIATDRKRFKHGKS